LLQAFTSLPPWVQTAVITGWGLNKLTGGALGSIVGELGKGLIKGVLGMNAGVVNINAAAVRGPGLIGDVAPAAGAGRLAGILKATIVGSVVVAGFAAWAQSVADAVDKNNKIQAEAGGTLTAAEIEAKKYYEGDARYQQEAQKHLGRIPSRADYESALAKALDRNESLRSMASASKDDNAQLRNMGTALTELKVQSHTDLDNVVTAIKNIKISTTGAVNNQQGGGATPRTSRPGAPSAPRTPTVNPQTGFVVTSVVSTRDVNTSRDVRTRIGPTPTEVGAA
jgi:hypothetical protein